MRKRIQNKVAESRKTLPITLLYGAAIWLLAGTIQHQWWLQSVCFLLSVLLMIHINNKNVLIRIYSRMVSVSFVFLTCVAPHLFHSIPGAIFEVAICSSLFLLFCTYQDQQAIGKSFYAYLCIGMSSLVYIQVLYLVPALWLMMALTLNSFSWRTFFASILGLICPYWIVTGWIIGREHGNFEPWIQYLMSLGQFQFSYDYSTLAQNQLLVFIFVSILGFIGIIQFMLKSYNDKIRVRQIYYSLLILYVTSILLLIAQPQLYDMLIRVMVITTSPFIGHFIALTNNRFTNIVFIIITGVALALTAYDLWTLSPIF